MEQEYAPAPCRIIMQDGRFTKQATETDKQRPLVVADSKPNGVAPAPTKGALRQPPVVTRALAKTFALPSPIPRMDGTSIERIKELQVQGLSITVIAERLGCSAALIWRRIREANGGRTRARFKFSPEKVAEAVRRRQAGESTSEVAKALHMSLTKVRMLVRQANG